MILTSTQVDEEAQYFYRKIGYIDCDDLIIDISQYKQPMECLIKSVMEKMKNKNLYYGILERSNHFYQYYC